MADANRIQSVEPDQLRPRTKRVVIPRRAHIESDKLNDFIESVTSDLGQMSALGQSALQTARQGNHVVSLDQWHAAQARYALDEQISFDRRMRALRGERVSHWYDLHDGSGVFFLEGAALSKRAMVSTLYGQATVPMNGIESRTYAIRLISGGVVTSSATQVSTTGVFDKLEGDGVVDYEQGGTVEETDPKNCTNGNNQSIWRRRVVFDLESDVSEVECEITIRVPDSANIYSNLVYLHPFPLRNVDVTGVWVASDLSGSFAPLLDSGPPRVNSAGRLRWFVPQQKVAEMKIRLRQRTWYEENGKKVFEYGLQEAGLQLVDWDKDYDSDAASLTDNHAFVVQIDAEEGFRFRGLHGFYSGPDFTKEPIGQRHLHFVVATDPEGTNRLWSSDSAPPPQNTAMIYCGDVSVLYIITTLNWASTVAVGSPFPAGTTPYLNGFGLDVTYVQEA